MRITQDGYSVAEYETVYEILFVYLNDEVTEAVVNEIQVKNVPFKCKIWKQYYACLSECSKINKPQIISDDDERRILIPVKTKDNEGTLKD